MWPDPLLQFRRVSLDPSKEGRMINRDAAVGQHQFEIAVADREHQLPADSPEDHLAREMPPLEGLHRHDPPTSPKAIIPRPQPA